MGSEMCIRDRLYTNPELLRPRLDLDDGLDLDGHAERQRVRAHRGTRVHAPVAEHLEQEVRASINNAGLVLEIIRTRHEGHELVHLCGNQNFTARSTSTPSTRRLPDGVVIPVPHRSTEPARLRHRREMT